MCCLEQIACMRATIGYLWLSFYNVKAKSVLLLQQLIHHHSLDSQAHLVSTPHYWVVNTFNINTLKIYLQVSNFTHMFNKMPRTSILLWNRVHQRFSNISQSHVTKLNKGRERERVRKTLEGREIAGLVQFLGVKARAASLPHYVPAESVSRGAACCAGAGARVRDALRGPARGARRCRAHGRRGGCVPGLHRICKIAYTV